MTKYQVSIGDRFGDWVVLDTRLSTNKKQRQCLCECKCGAQTAVNYYNLVYGVSKGCGCGRDMKTTSRNKTHGLSHTRAYKAWCSMWTRCTNRNVKCQSSYEVRSPPSIWRQFDVFYAEMGECPEGLTLERKDNTKPYEPGNCIWATQAQQSLNRGNVIKVTIDGTPVSLKKACAILGFVYPTVVSRLKRNGGDVEAAMNHTVKLYLGGLYG